MKVSKIIPNPRVHIKTKLAFSVIKAKITCFESFSPVASTACLKKDHHEISYPCLTFHSLNYLTNLLNWKAVLQKAAVKDWNIKYDFCVNSLESNPHGKSATSIKGLVIASSKNAAFNMINVERIAKTNLNKRKTSPGNKAALLDCIELYNDANSSLNKALTNVKSQDYSRANEYLISAFDALRICEDIFTKIKKAKSPIRDENNNII
ncbi:unnamed protein product [Thlaspi arvense]|uniref:Pectinesterase inhibitor domain-containing protein n=1 Tax=Thlaspi arvense TaxID=13288 RepID=A0AAU9R7U4_THLAR|nr:unnamed protein product [Thlaspi arvense]